MPDVYITIAQAPEALQSQLADVLELRAADVQQRVAWLGHDRWFVRRLPALLKAAGWTVTRARSHGYTETDEPGYALTLVDRGAAMLAAAGTFGEETAEALGAEARRRVAAGTFYGHINYGSFAAARAADTV
jgi:hypothetical protein